jgi:outer membrane protein assembly factor BamC
MSNQLKIFLCGILLACVSGCSHIYGENGVIKNRETDYLKAQDIGTMQLPPGYNTKVLQNNYPVTANQYPDNRARVDLTPPGLAAPPPPPVKTSGNATE